jgi:glucuronoarabinoxylan endo-1,4-beta-xylanase
MRGRFLTQPKAARRFICRCLILLLTLGYAAIAPDPAKAANVTVTVNYNSPRQTVEGFGASTTWVANDFEAFSAAKQTQILDLLYNTSVAGAGLSWIRVGTFLCNFNPSPGVYDWNHWGIQTQMRWIQRVNTAYGINKYLVSTWSPPAWMKDNNSCTNGGHVLSQYYPDLATAKIQWLLNARTQLGIEPNIESVQNEPSQKTSYDSCEWTAAEMVSFVTGHLQPALSGSGLATKIMVPEPAIYSNFDASWGTPILGNASMRSAVSMMATHAYGRTDDLSKPCTSCTQYNKPLWQTEHGNLNGRYDGSIDEGLTWATEIYKAMSVGQFNAWFYWWVLTTQNDNQGLINASPTTDSFQVPKRLFVIGQYSRFIRPGAALLASTSSDSAVQVTAVRPTTGSVAVVIANTGRNSQTVTVSLSGLSNSPATLTPYRTSASENQALLSPVSVSSGAFTITVPAKSIVTVVG